MPNQSSHGGGEPAETCFVTLKGEYDISRAHELDEVFAGAHQAKKVVIDFRLVTYIDSTVLTKLLQLKKSLSLPGQSDVIELRNVSPTVRRVFTVSGLDDLFEFR
jgi:anti-anti-sigma factor